MENTLSPLCGTLRICQTIRNTLSFRFYQSSRGLGNFISESLRESLSPCVLARNLPQSTTMVVICGACQATNSPKSRFCQKCGVALPITSAGEETTAPPAAEITEDHDDVTVEFHPRSAPPPQAFSVPTPADPPERHEPPPSSLSEPFTHNEPEIIMASQPEPPVPVLDSEASCPLTLGLNFDRVFVAENPSTFEILVESQSEMPLENVEILFESARTLGNPLRFDFKRIAPAQKLRRRIEIEPNRAGNFVLQCSVMMELRGEKQSFIGSRPLRVNAVPDTSNIVVNIGDIQGNDGGANAGLGAEYGDVKISNLVDASNIRTLNDLLDLELPEKFQLLDLQLDYQLSLRSLTVARAGLEKTLSIPSALVGVCQTGVILRLTPTDTASGPEFKLVARPRLTFGRSRQEADFVTWFWPRSKENDAKSMRISGIQAVAEAHQKSIFACDAQSANGSTYNGVALEPETGIPLDRRGTLAFGAAYELDVLHVPSRLEKGPPAITNLRLWNGPEDPGTPLLGSVRFVPVNTEPTPFQTLWLLSDAEFGRSHSNPLIFPDETLAEIQGRFLHWRGCFWLENNVANEGVTIDQVNLDAGDIAPLATGQRLRLGQTIYRLEVGV